MPLARETDSRLSPKIINRQNSCESPSIISLELSANLFYFFKEFFKGLWVMLLKDFRFGIVYALAITLVLSCSSSRKTTREETSKKEAAQYDESFDPVRLDDDHIDFKEESKPAAHAKGTDRIDILREPAEKEDKLVDGFRIQLFATKDIESATIAKKEAQFVFANDSLNVYVEFDSPYYKLRIGDFRDRDKAEQFREITREKGYSSSWIVKTKVWSNPSPYGDSSHPPENKESQFQN